MDRPITVVLNNGRLVLKPYLSVFGNFIYYSYFNSRFPSLNQLMRPKSNLTANSRLSS